MPKAYKLKVKGACFSQARNKEQEVALLEDRFKRAVAMIFTDFRGLTATEMVELRQQLTRNELEYRVIRNTLARLAAKRAGVSLEEFLDGPTGICFGYTDPTLPFRLASELAKKYANYRVKGGIIEGEKVPAAEVEKIAQLPSRQVLLARLAYVCQGPMQKLAITLNGIIKKLVIVLKELEKQKEGGALSGAVSAFNMIKEEILEAIDNMSVKELAELVSAIEERYKVSAAAAVPTITQAPAPAGGATTATGAAVAEKTTLKVVLKNAGQQKVPLIKKIKEITGKGLKECKDLVDNLPSAIKEGIEEEEAKRIKAQLEELGAEVELQ